MTATTSNLERRYRVLLKVLPQWYREDREEEMVGLFLVERTDELDLEHSWPGWGETGAMLALAIRTRFAATSAPDRVVRQGEVVRWLGVLGLVLGLKFIVHSVYSEIYVRTHEAFAVPPQWVVVGTIAPLIALVLLVRGQRTWAKVVAGVMLLPWLVNVLSDPGPAGWQSVLWQLPALVGFVCLCLGFHREAPVPRAKAMLWWGGGAVLVGAAELAAWWLGPLVLPVVVLGIRVWSHVRGEMALGRALSVFAVLFAVDLVVTYVSGPPEWRGYGLVAAALWLVSAAAPVRRASVPRSRLP
jgi:hypothetical protein